MTKLPPHTTRLTQEATILTPTIVDMTPEQRYHGQKGITKGVSYEVLTDHGALVQVMVSNDRENWYDLAGIVQDDAQLVSCLIGPKCRVLVPVNDYIPVRYYAISAKLPEGVESAQITVTGFVR